MPSVKKINTPAFISNIPAIMLKIPPALSNPPLSVPLDAIYLSSSFYDGRSTGF
jgi:hypothetical protein